MKKAQHYAVILAGGGGTRLWPVSRLGRPKQIQPFLDDQTLLQKTYQRLRKIYPPKQILLSTNQAQLTIIRQQLPHLPLDQYIIEPQKRDTAAAVGLIAAVLAAHNPNNTFVTINSDQHIVSLNPYYQTLKKVEATIKKYPEQTVLVGLKPDYPETGYGYIEVAKQKKSGLYDLKRFVEKPDLKTAQRYLKNKNYLWNPALFAWRAGTVLELFKKHLSSGYQPLLNISQNPSINNIKNNFIKLPIISVDYGLLEKIKQAIVIKADYKFTDIGHWETLRSVLTTGQKPEQNLIKGLAIVNDSTGNLIYNFTDQLIATTGLRDMIIVKTPDALFVAPRHKAQDVKQIVKILKEQGLEKYL